ncbi:hypothetical protein [Lentzea sp. NPDC092896]|uniref:hypothetical protein n=1 Tax=Lentzea sp. NPDC092896 TaxID=3364127 RepID=UPI00382CBEB1
MKLAPGDARGTQSAVGEVAAAGVEEGEPSRDRPQWIIAYLKPVSGWGAPIFAAAGFPWWTSVITDRGVGG